MEDSIEHDFNKLETAASALIRANRPQDAIKIYLHMAEGDPSLDAGYLAEQLGICYESVGDLHAAKYWYGRAVEENGAVRSKSNEARQGLKDISINSLLRI